MQNYKVGDKVLIVEDLLNPENNGKIGVIKRISENKSRFEIDLVNGEKGIRINLEPYMKNATKADKIELIPKAVTTKLYQPGDKVTLVGTKYGKPNFGPYTDIFKVGEIVTIIKYCKSPTTEKMSYEVEKSNKQHWYFYSEDFVETKEKLNQQQKNIKQEGKNKMSEEIKIENIKPENLKTAKEQFDEDNKNAEIDAGITALRKATDEVNRIDRNIKSLNEEREPHQKVIDMFTPKKE